MFIIMFTTRIIAKIMNMSIIMLWLWLKITAVLRWQDEQMRITGYLALSPEKPQTPQPGSLNPRP